MNLSFLRPHQLLNKKLKRNFSHSLLFLNISQFLGIVNDNIFKLVLVFMLIDQEGKSHASAILSTAGMVYVLPFLFFSYLAGNLADWLSKQRMLIGMKLAELVIMGLAFFAFSTHSQPWGYFLLFLLGSHSALFGPAKYGIIPELVPKEKISKANGLITSFTYLAMIIGTFLGSFLTDMTHHSYEIIILICFLIACVGFFSACGIQKTVSQGKKRERRFFFLAEIYQTLKTTKKTEHLLAAILGSAYFLFLGAFMQLNIIPFTIQALHYNEVAGGYLFLSTALGIAGGAYIGGKASKKRIELGVSCLAGFAMALLILILAFLDSHLFTVVFCLVLLGVFGGLFVVPLDSFIQTFSPSARLGQNLGATNFLSFLGVLLASFFLYFFSEVLSLSASQGFLIISTCTGIVSLILFFALSDLALPFFARKFLKPFFSIQMPPREALQKNSNWILYAPSFLDVLLFLSIAPPLHLLIPHEKKSLFSWHRFFYSLHKAPLQNPEGRVNELSHLPEGIRCIWLQTSLGDQSAIDRDTSFLSIRLERHKRTIRFSVF
jgi:acyl-[acyl-carrier-protein]-phospholipid O-acyltransferase / long-chain-fatty-acid--[acyl-carrier-protein] ligase